MSSLEPHRSESGATVFLIGVFLLACTSCSSVPRKSASDYTDEESRKLASVMPTEAKSDPEAPRKLLVFSKCEGYVHDCIPVAKRAFEIMGEMTGAFTVETSDDMKVFEPQSLARFDAVLFNNATRLAFENEAYRQALVDFVRGGKGLIGIHAATDSFYEWEEGARMIGGQFDGHPWNSSGTWAVKIDEPSHTLNEDFEGKGFLIEDEIYQIKGSYSRDTHRVLLSLDMTNPRNRRDKGINRDDSDFAISWVKRFGEGRIFYCSLGHNSEVYSNAPVLEHYLAGIQYALGDLEIDDAPSGSLAEAPVAALTTTKGAVDDPFVVLPSYEFAQSRVPLTVLEERIRDASPEQLVEIEEALIEIGAEADTTFAARQFICRLLRRMGTARCYPLLQEYLRDSRLNHPARFALQGLPGPEVDSILRDAFQETSGVMRIGVIDSLASRKDRQAVSLLEQALGEELSSSAPDHYQLHALIVGLGRIGGSEAVSALKKAELPAEYAQERDLALLRCADASIEEGKNDEAAELLTELIESEKISTPSLIAAYRGLLRAVPEKDMATLATMLHHSSVDVKEAAGRFLIELPKDKDTSSLFEVWTTFDAKAWEMALQALGARGDRWATPLAERAMEDDRVELRIAAMEALGSIGDASHVSSLAALVNAEGAEGEAASKSSETLRGEGVDEELLRCLATFEGEARARLIPCIVARRTEGAIEALVTCCSDGHEDVRLEALRGLGRLCREQDLASLVGTLEGLGTATDFEEAEKAIERVCRRVEDDKAIAFIASGIEERSLLTKASLLRVLGRVHGEIGYNTLVTATADEDEAIRLVALESLGEWPDNTPRDELLRLTREAPTEGERAAAAAGALVMVSRSDDIEGDRIREIYEELYVSAQSADERRAVIESVATIKEVWVVGFLKPLKDDPELSDVATSSIRVVESALARKVPHEAQGSQVTLTNPHSDRYDGGGEGALVDGKWGSTSHGDGRWQGFEGEDLEAVIDLGRILEVESIRVGFLSSMGSWIFAPEEVEYSLSLDGVAYEAVATLTGDKPTEMQDAALKDFVADVEGREARYLRVKAKNIGACPEWHPGVGGTAWLFVDEIQVNPRF